MAVHLVMRISFLLLLTYELAEAAPPPIAKPNCISSCGNVTKIPYPFGIGPECHMDQSFEIVCHGNGSSAKAFLPSIDMEMLEIGISDPYNDNYYSPGEPGSVRVNMPIISSNCGSPNQSGGVNFTERPFYFSSARNKFISVGCDNMALLSGINPMVVVGCKSDCNNPSMIDKELKYCSSCCQATIYSGIKVFDVEFKSLKEDKASAECKHAFLGEQQWLDSYKKDLSYDVQYLEYVPVMLGWIAPNLSNKPRNANLNKTMYGGQALNFVLI